MNKLKNLVLGADIGGSHITTALIDLDCQVIVKESLIRRRVNAHGNAYEIIRDWSLCIQHSMEFTPRQISSFGIAIPGPFDYLKGISKIKGVSKYDALFGLNIKELLSEQLGVRVAQIKLNNDAACFLQGEAFSGAAKGYNHAIGLTLGTGLGTARFHYGKGDDANLWCMPFKNSIAEDYISTRWFVNRYEELTGLPIKDVEALADLYANNEKVISIFKEFGQNLASFLIEFIRIDKPDVVVIGGNIANAYAFFKNEIESYFEKKKIDIPVFQSTLNEEAAILGAASLWTDRTENVIL